MKIKPTLELCPDLLELRYDQEARKVFATTAKIISRLLDRDSRRRPHGSSKDSLEHFAVSALALKHLGSVASRKMRLRPEEMQEVLTLACISAMRFLGQPRRIKPFEQLLLLLAQSTPTPVFLVDLPPIDQVFDQQTVLAGVRKTFELLPKSNTQEIPYLYVHDIYQLLLALRNIQRPSPAVRKLIADLDLTICPFRAVMEKMANKERTLAPGKGERKGQAALRCGSKS
jgi:hypothetical protein